MKLGELSEGDTFILNRTGEVFEHRGIMHLRGGTPRPGWINVGRRGAKRTVRYVHSTSRVTPLNAQCGKIARCTDSRACECWYDRHKPWYADQARQRREHDSRKEGAS